MSKTYFITQTAENELPIEFVCSKNDKYISFQYCKCTCNGYMDSETSIHASFIQRDQYCDSMIWYTNLLPPDDNRKYSFIGTNRKFKIWFKGPDGKVLTPDSFTAFFKLEY